MVDKLVLHSEKIDNLRLKLNFYFEVSIIGAFRGGICLFLEHPLDCIKTQWQDNIKLKSTKEVIKHIYLQKGISGFYYGFTPSLIRATSKNIYRWPMMMFFPRLYDKYVQVEIKSMFPGIVKFLTGLSIANIEIMILCPLDRIKVFLMTSSHVGSDFTKIKHFYNLNKQNLFRELFRGIEPTFWRSNVSWVSFLYLDFKLKRIFRNFDRYKKSNSPHLSFFDLIIISFLVGIGNNLLSKF
jgi:hypothetical protein